jgi:hypothetical protein
VNRIPGSRRLWPTTARLRFPLGRAWRCWPELANSAGRSLPATARNASEQFSREFFFFIRAKMLWSVANEIPIWRFSKIEQTRHIVLWRTTLIESWFSFSSGHLPPPDQGLSSARALFSPSTKTGWLTELHLAHSDRLMILERGKGTRTWECRPPLARQNRCNRENEEARICGFVSRPAKNGAPLTI